MRQARVGAERLQGPVARIPAVPPRTGRFGRLALNVSRETLQDNSVVRKIRTSLVKGVLDRLDHLAQDDADKFRAFYDQFGRTLKEGLVVDPANKERIAKLLRFPSSKSDDPKARVSFDEYIARMPAGQSRSTTWEAPTSRRSPRAPTSKSSAARGSKSCT